MVLKPNGSPSLKILNTFLLFPKLPDALYLVCDCITATRGILVSIGIKDAYLQGPISPSISGSCDLRWASSTISLWLFLLVCLWVFTKMLAPIMVLLHFQVIQFIRYLDNLFQDHFAPALLANVQQKRHWCFKCIFNLQKSGLDAIYYLV